MKLNTINNAVSYFIEWLKLTHNLIKEINEVEVVKVFNSHDVDYVAIQFQKDDSSSLLLAISGIDSKNTSFIYSELKEYDMNNLDEECERAILKIEDDKLKEINNWWIKKCEKTSNNKIKKNRTEKVNLGNWED